MKPECQYLETCVGNLAHSLSRVSHCNVRVFLNVSQNNDVRYHSCKT